jgi:hypothetical protein
MVTPLLLGLEHPSLLWIVATSVLAFAVGLGVRAWRDRRTSAPETDVDGVENVE